MEERGLVVYFVYLHTSISSSNFALHHTMWVQNDATPPPTSVDGLTTNNTRRFNSCIMAPSTSHPTYDSRSSTQSQEYFEGSDSVGLAINPPIVCRENLRNSSCITGTKTFPNPRGRSEVFILDVPGGESSPSIAIFLIPK